MQGYQRLSKTLNIHSKSRLFRANTHCFSIIIDCLRDSFWYPRTGKTIFNSVKVPFFFVLSIISSYLCSQNQNKLSFDGTERAYQPHQGAFEEASHHPNVARQSVRYELQYH